jgi:putative peptidoglycan lipid II flippase
VTRRPIFPQVPSDEPDEPGGYYEPDAPTIEMPIIDSPAFADQQALLRPRRPARRVEPRRPAPRPPDGRTGGPAPPAPPGPPPGPPKEASQPSGSRASLVVTAGIFLSSTAGLIRETVISRYLGTGRAADAFKAALRIPNMLQNLMGEGALSASFIPAYSRLRKQGHEDEAGRLAGAIAGLLMVTAGIASLLGLIFAEQIARVLVPGFGSGEKFDLTVKLVRIMFPGIAFVVLSAWCLGVLNSHRKFFLSYVAPVLWSAAQIVAVVTVGFSTSKEADLATALAWGVTIGGLLQLLVQLGPTIRLLGGVRLSLDAGRESVQHVLRRFAPVATSKGAVQIMAFVDLWLASYLATGAVSTLSYALPIYFLPISMFGIGVSAAELPDLSEVEVYDPDTRRLFRRRLEDGMARIAFYVFPIAAMYIVAGDVISRAIFQHGEFGADDTWAMWITLAVFAVGLPATTASRLFQNGLYALDETKTPARLAIMRVVISTVVSLAFMFPLDRLIVPPGGGKVEGWGDIWALGPLSESVRNSNRFVHLGIVALALGATVAAWIEYHLLSRAVAWRIGRSRLAGRWINPIAVSSALASLAAFLMVQLTQGLPGIVAAILVFTPAGILYLVVSRSLQVPEAIVTAERIGAIAERIGIARR